MRAAIIFDFDGTLGDSFKVALEIAHEITHRSILVEPEEVARLRKMRLLDVARELRIPRWQWPFLLIRGRRLMARRLGEVQPFQGVPEMLASLHRDNYQLFIMSSNSVKNIQQFLITHGLSGYFTNIYGGVGLLDKSRALGAVMRQNKLRKDDVIYIGDEPRDVIASKRVGVPCVAVGWGYNTPEVLSEQAPMVVVHTAAQLLKILEEWASAIG